MKAGTVIANLLTGIRALCGVLLIFVPVFSKAFYLLYLAGGLTDAADGWVARKLGKPTVFGARFDTVADAVFILAVLGKVIASVQLPLFLLIWTGVILLIKVVSLIVGIRKQHCFLPVHSMTEKICGAVVFTVPVFLGADFAWQGKVLAAGVVCLIATIVAVWELWETGGDK